jgi:hypothetical protein
MALESADQMTEEEQALREYVREKFDASERLRKSFDDRWNIWYGLSRNYRRLARGYKQASSPNDADTVMDEMRRTFGEELFIPYGFTVIETNVPRILATDPRMSVKPNDQKQLTYEACEPVKQLYERDQKRMAYETKLQETVRSGLRYGLGVQKLYWQRKYRSGQRVVPMETKDGFQVIDDNRILVFEGPMAESCDIFDFFWDPAAHDLGESCEYLIHRTWRSMRYVEERVSEGKEMRAKGLKGGWAEVDLDTVKGLASSTKRGEIWQGRHTAAGMADYQARGNEEVEVWEFHERDRVATILGRELVVQNALNPFMHGDYPFQIYRPTIVEHEFVGVGEIEPIAHLQYELNEMRGQRRDAATLALNRGYFYSQGMLNPKTVRTGAGVFVPVQGDPKDVIFPMPFQDIPASGVSEEEALKRDIELTTGISESTVGSEGEETATGTQLVQQAANQRIRQKAKNLHPDLLRPAAAQMRELYRQHITDPNKAQEIRVEADQMPGQEQTPAGYAFIKVGPRELNANIEVEPVDGSTEADNEVQKRSDAVQMVDALAPFIEELDAAKVAKYVLMQFGVDQPDEMLKPPGPKADEVVQVIGQTLRDAGASPDFITQVLEAAHQRLEEGPPPEEGGAEGGSSNGAGREPEPTPGGVHGTQEPK